MIQFRKNSYANIILEYIALCGEFPYNSLDILGKNKVILQRTLNNLKKEGYITISGSGVMKTIRITKKSFEVIDAINPNFLQHYLTVSENHHFRGGTYKNNNVGARQTWRRHRMAEILCLMYQNGVKIWEYQKPQLSLSTSTVPQISENDLLFYTSKELKNADKNQRYKTDFTRIMGAIFSPGGIYCVYNTHKGLMKWNSQGEGKAQVLVEDIVQHNSQKHHEDFFVAEDAIMFGKGMSPVSDILNSNGSNKDSNGFELLSFDNTYRNIYYITLDENGKEQLKIMTSPCWHEKLCNAIFPEAFIDFKHSIIDCDAIDKSSDTYILMFFDGNIGRLKRFKQAAYDSKKNFELLCFPWQIDVLQQYVESKIKLRTLQLEDIKNIYKDTK